MPSSVSPTVRGRVISSALRASAAASATGPTSSAARPQKAEPRMSVSSPKSAMRPKTTYEAGLRESCASVSLASSSRSLPSGSAAAREVSGGSSPSSSAFTVGSMS